MAKRTTSALLAVSLILCAMFAVGDALRVTDVRAAPEVAPWVAENRLDAEPGASPEEPADASDEPAETTPPAKRQPPPAQVVNEAERIETSLKEYMKINPEVMGWIYVPDTDIDYPFVLGEDNDFYLDHSPEKYYSIYGAIFEDFENHPDIDDNRNTVLYGHNVRFGGMFHDVEKFLEKDFFDKTPIYLYTTEKVYIYEPFSIFEASYDYQYFQVDFKDDGEYVAFMREMRDNSRFPRDIDFTAEDRMLTLSTCTNGAKTQRWSFQSILVETVELSEWEYLIYKNPVLPERRRAPEWCELK